MEFVSAFKGAIGFVDEASLTPAARSRVRVLLVVSAQAP